MRVLQNRLMVDPAILEEINAFLADPGNELARELLRVVSKYGTPEQINAAAREARALPGLLERLRRLDSPYLRDLEWLMEARDRNAFTSISAFRASVLGEGAAAASFDEARAVTLEISALQYFPWLMAEARLAAERREIMPGRYIRVRKMREQEEDQGDIMAVAAAMQVIGASWVETLDTRGTDGSNVHLGGPETITGYFGGVGQPNEHALQWVDEALYYYTRYGIPEFLNVNPGTVLLGYMLYRLGVDICFKISVFMGNDNPYSVLWTLLMARFFARADGSTPLAGFNLSNSVHAGTLRAAAAVRRTLGLESAVRIEHHITETRKSIVRQPYLRRDELLEVARTVPNISAKHEGGDPEVEAGREHPSDILDYFRPREEILASGDMPALEQNYLDKHDAVNRTARALTEHGLSFIGARRLHRR